MTTDLTPEHTARRQGDNEELHPEVRAAYRYVESVLDSADIPSGKLGGPLWFGWALREAFLAGCSRAHIALAQPEPEIEPAAYIHRQGNYTEVSEMSLSGDEKARGWTEEPLFRHPLAQPEPEGPTDEELIQLAIDTRLYRFQATAGDPIQYEMTEQQVHAFARVVLARWGRSTIEPVPVAERLPGPEDCDAEGRCWIGMWNEIDGEQIPDWELSTPAHYTWKGITAISCWLPHHALPIPTP